LSAKIGVFRDFAKYFLNYWRLLSAKSVIFAMLSATNLAEKTFLLGTEPMPEEPIVIK
jgi:hypothetical protein